MTSSREYLFSLEAIGIKLGLEQIRALLDALDRPDRAFPAITVAGTNGKGSVTAMVERALRAAGYRTGRYTSPHLVHLEERFAVGGTSIAPDVLDRIIGRIRQAAAMLPAPPSFFEATTAVALEAFRDAQVDVAVLEVGLGGRLDATNVVTPVAVAITSIAMDHEAYLGHSLEAIAREKAGIIKPGIVTVLARNPPEVEAVVAGACATAGARLIRADQNVAIETQMVDGHAHVAFRTPGATYDRVRLGLRGRHQVDNAMTAVRLLEALVDLGWSVTPDAIRLGLEAVDWPGRLDVRHWRGGQVIIDGAHNPAGAAALASYLDETYGRPLPLVLGLMRDKEARGIIAALGPRASHVICTAAESPRAAAPDDLATAVVELLPGMPVITRSPAIAAVLHAQTLGDPIVVAGSLYLAGEVRARIEATS